MSNNLKVLEDTTSFHNFSEADYNKWKIERKKDPRPLSEFEPVGYFRMKKSIFVTKQLDVK